MMSARSSLRKRLKFSQPLATNWSVENPPPPPPSTAAHVAPPVQRGRRRARALFPEQARALGLCRRGDPGARASDLPLVCAGRALRGAPHGPLRCAAVCAPVRPFLFGGDAPRGVDGASDGYARARRARCGAEGRGPSRWRRRGWRRGAGCGGRRRGGRGRRRRCPSPRDGSPPDAAVVAVSQEQSGLEAVIPPLVALDVGDGACAWRRRTPPARPGRGRHCRGSPRGHAATARCGATAGSNRPRSAQYFLADFIFDAGRSDVRRSYERAGDGVTRPHEGCRRERDLQRRWPRGHARSPFCLESKAAPRGARVAAARSRPAHAVRVAVTRHGATAAADASFCGASSRAALAVPIRRPAPL
jgi:hypothetical protein